MISLDFSVDFSVVFTCPRVSVLAEAQALTRWMARWPALRSWERRTVLPSMATTSPGIRSDTAWVQAMQHCWNCSGSSREKTSPKVSWDGMPWGSSRKVWNHGQPKRLAEGGVQVDGQRIIARPRTSLPGLGQQLPAHPIQLADMAPPETPQEGSQRGRRLDYTAQHPIGSPCAQRGGGVDAVATGQCRRHQVSRVNYICQSCCVNQFCRFTSSAWPRCWAALVR